MLIAPLFCLKMPMSTAFRAVNDLGDLANCLFANGGKYSDNRFAGCAYVLCCSVFLDIN